MADFLISLDAVPFYLYINPGKSNSSSQTNGDENSIVVQLTPEKTMKRPTKADGKHVGGDPAQWSIPCAVKEFQHENGRVQTGLQLKFHPTAFKMSTKDENFAAQLRKAGLQSLQDHLAEKHGLSDCQLSPEPPLEHCRSQFAEKIIASLRVTQNPECVVLLWSFPETTGLSPPFLSSSCVELSANIDQLEKDLVELTLSFGNTGAEIGTFFCRAESGKAFGAVRAYLTTSRRSLSLQMSKLDFPKGQFSEEPDAEGEECSFSGQMDGPWTHLYIGTSKDGLSLVTFPETRVLQTQAALQRSRDIGNRQRYARTRLHLQCRPLMLLQADQNSALVHVSNYNSQDARNRPVPLSVFTELYNHPQGLTSLDSSPSNSPDSVETGDSGIGSDSGAANRRSSAESGGDPKETRNGSGSGGPAPGFLRNRSMSESGIRFKGILKRPGLVSRSMSECVGEVENDGCYQGMMDSCDGCDSCFTGSECDGDDPVSNSLGSRIRRKSVRFNEKVFEVCFRTNSSILGQKKKNARKDKCRRKRRNSEGGQSASESESEKSEKEKEFICGSYVPLSLSVDDETFAKSPPTYGRRPCSTIPEEIKNPSEEATKFGLWFDLIEPNHEPDQSMYDSTEDPVIPEKSNPPKKAKKKKGAKGEKSDSEIVRESAQRKRRQKQATKACLNDERYKGFVLLDSSGNPMRPDSGDQSDSDHECQQVRKSKEEDEGWQRVVSKRKRRGKRRNNDAVVGQRTGNVKDRASTSRESEGETSDLGFHLEVEE